MCGRFVSVFTTEDLLAVASGIGGSLQTPADVEIESSDYNVAPSRELPLFLPAPDGHVTIAKKSWGLVPGWKRDGGGRPLINARSETAAEKATFKKLTATGRCLVPMTGYYEWKTDPNGRKIPYFISSDDGSPLLTGALVSEPDGCFVILTRDAPPEIHDVHDRSPLLLRSSDADEWVHATEWPDPRAFLDRAPGLRARRTTRDVNSIRNNGPHLLDSPDTGLFGS